MRVHAYPLAASLLLGAAEDADYLHILSGTMQHRDQVATFGQIGIDHQEGDCQIELADEKHRIGWSFGRIGRVSGGIQQVTEPEYETQVAIHY